MEFGLTRMYCKRSSQITVSDKSIARDKSIQRIDGFPLVFCTINENNNFVQQSSSSFVRRIGLRTILLETVAARQLFCTPLLLFTFIGHRCRWVVLVATFASRQFQQLLLPLVSFSGYPYQKLPRSNFTLEASLAFEKNKMSGCLFFFFKLFCKVIYCTLLNLEYFPCLKLSGRISPLFLSVRKVISSLAIQCPLAQRRQMGQCNEAKIGSV